MFYVWYLGAFTLWFILIWFVLKMIDLSRGISNAPVYDVPTFPVVRSGPQPRHPLNVPGDFYTVKDVCIMCGAPEAEAMGLMTHSEEGCYFIRQPQTNDEVMCAINAIAVSCIASVRYGGTNQKIIKKLHELRCGNECDHPLDESSF